jgi:hypothetical protein
MVQVFGSNEKGFHGGGAAHDAYKNHGAKYNVGFGPQGNSFAIPTCSKPTGEPGFKITSNALRYYVYCFILYAKMTAQGLTDNPADTKFKVTRIGTGLAGWKDEEVAPLFKEAPDNCQFDSAWDAPGLLPGRKYWGTYDQMVVVGSTAPFIAATITPDEEDA